MKDQINRLSLIARPYVEKITNELNHILTEDLGELIQRHQQFREAFRVLPIFSVRISRITTGILDLVIEDNLYSCKILLRALIEHTFKVDFLIEKSLKENNDNIYKEYLLFCDLSEELQYQKSLDFKSQKLEDKEISEDAYKDLIERKPDIKKYSKNEITEKANQFTFRNIFRFLNDKKNVAIDLDNELRKYYDAYLHTGAIYSDLSSFVHGGPFADNFEFRNHLDKNEGNSEVIETVEWVMVVHFAACLAIVEFFNKLDKKYEKNVTNIVNFLSDYFQKF